MVKKSNPNSENPDAFKQAAKDIKLLKSDKIRLRPRVTKPPVSKPVEPNEPSYNLDRAPNIMPVTGDAHISYKHVSISNKILRNLRKGQYNIEAVLDLHGLTSDEAMMAVDQFLHQSVNEGRQVVLIIHGKGHNTDMPILKNKLNQWLRALNVVLAFCSAAPTHGGQGAMYILLKRGLRE